MNDLNNSSTPPEEGKKLITGLKLVFIEIFVVILVIIGILAILNFTGVFNIQNFIRSILTQSENAEISRDNLEQNLDEDANLVRLPFGLKDEAVRDIIVEYTLYVPVSNITDLPDGTREIEFSNTDLPSFTRSARSYVPEIIGDQRTATQVADLMPGSTIVWTFYYHPLTNEWSSREAENLPNTR